MYPSKKVSGIGQSGLSLGGRPLSARRIAEKTKQKHYHGKPCPHGHGTLRYTVNCCCVGCTKASVKREWAYHKAWNRMYRQRNRERINAYHVRWVARNRMKVDAWNRHGHARLMNTLRLQLYGQI